jgi:hypothetical protein
LTRNNRVATASCAGVCWSDQECARVGHNLGTNRSLTYLTRDEANRRRALPVRQGRRFLHKDLTVVSFRFLLTGQHVFAPLFRGLIKVSASIIAFGSRIEGNGGRLSNAAALSCCWSSCATRACADD